MTSFYQIVTLSFFQFIASLEQFRSWIPDGQWVKLTFSLIVTFTLQNLKTELKNLELNSRIIILGKDTIFAKNVKFLPKNAEISKISEILVLTYQIYVPSFKFLA